MSEFGAFLLFIGLLTLVFVSGVVITSKTTTYKLGQESILLLEQCELPLPREEFCELVATPKGAE